METTNESLISKISNIIIEDSLIIIQDKTTSSIFIFNKDGKFKTKILKLGQGPGEYNEVSDLMIDIKRNLLMVYDVNMSKMIFYTINGDYVREINLFSNGMAIRDVINLPNGRFLCYSNEKTESHGILWEVDSVGVFSKNLLNNENSYPIYLTESSTYLYKLSENKFGLIDISSNNVYHYENDTLSKYLSYRLDAPSVTNYAGDFTRTKYHSIYSIQEKGDHILSLWTDENSQYYVHLYFKKDNASITSQGIVYDINIHGVWGFMLNVNRPDLMVLSVPPSIITRDLESEYQTEEVKAKLRKIISNMTEAEIEEMNPVLQIMYVKQSKKN